jgi:integrase
MATHYAEAGVPIQVTADQLRHKTIDTTRRIYTHVEARQRRQALDRVLEYSAESTSTGPQEDTN